MRLLATSAGSQAGSEQAVAPDTRAPRLICPVVPPVGGPSAWMTVPFPVAEMVVLEPVHVVPSESTVITPCTTEVPTVTCDPPSTFSGTHPVGSNTHSAGGLPVWGDGRTVAVRPVELLVTPRTP